MNRQDYRSTFLEVAPNSVRKSNAQELCVRVVRLGSLAHLYIQTRAENVCLSAPAVIGALVRNRSIASTTSRGLWAPQRSYQNYWLGCAVSFGGVREKSRGSLFSYFAHCEH